MSATTIGVAIGATPMVLILVAMLAVFTSTSDGRWGALFVFGGTTLVMIPAIIGLAVAGKPAWIVGVWVMVGLDAVVVVVMAAVERARKGRQS